MTDDRLDVGITQVRGLLDNQLASVDAIQTKIGVLLGFTSASLALLFSFGSGWATSHVAIAAVSAIALFVSASIFAASLMLTSYQQAPEPTWMVNLLNNPVIGSDSFKKQVIGAIWKAYDENIGLIDSRFKTINWAIALMVIGIGVFVGGVLMT